MGKAKEKTRTGDALGVYQVPPDDTIEDFTLGEYEPQVEFLVMIRAKDAKHQERLVKELRAKRLDVWSHTRDAGFSSALPKKPGRPGA